jgi:hypothetical protein
MTNNKRTTKCNIDPADQIGLEITTKAHEKEAVNKLVKVLWFRIAT